MARTRAIATVCAALLCCATAAASSVAQTPDAPSPPTSAGPPALPPLETLSETVERPLFLPDRRIPDVNEVVEDRSGAESGIFSLLGIIVSPTERIALVLVRGSAEVLQMSEGQQVSGWTVREIQPNKVIFESNDQTETLEFIDSDPAPRRERPTRGRRQRAEPPPQERPEARE